MRVNKRLANKMLGFTGLTIENIWESASGRFLLIEAWHRPSGRMKKYIRFIVTKDFRLFIDMPTEEQIRKMGFNVKEATNYGYK